MEAQREEAEREALDMPDLGTIERSLIEQQLDERGLSEHAINPDGHCLYAAFADQISQRLGKSVNIKDMRREAAFYIRSNPDTFAPFILADDHSSATDVESYADEVEGSAIWGGELEILALSQSLHVATQVLNSSKLTIEINMEEQSKGIMVLAYYRHLYGLGSHYNSCRG
jgi:OTU domain-containing protein 6